MASTYAYNQNGQLVRKSVSEVQARTRGRALSVVNRLKQYDETVKLKPMRFMEFLNNRIAEKSLMVINYVKKTTGESATIVGAITADEFGYLSYKDFEIERKLRTHSNGKDDYAGGKIWANTITSVIYNKVLYVCPF